MTGKVKWFDDQKGFGFLTPDDGSPEAFVHHSEIWMKGRRTLEPGQAVEFDISAAPNNKGPRAISVKAVGQRNDRHRNESRGTNSTDSIATVQ